ncbi:MAG: CRTAC1 family protein [Bacteroidales bacterium]
MQRKIPFHRTVLRSGLPVFLVSFAALILFSCSGTGGFKETTEAAGIDFRYNFGDTSYVNIMESSGSGITVFDYDEDGFMDVYLMNGTWLEGISDADGKVFANTPNELYRNRGDGTFEEVGSKAGVDDRHWSMAAGAVDYDADGDEDLFLLNYGPNVFYRNNGDGTFADITAQTGLQGPDSLNGYPKWSVAVSYWDVNRDGLLDAFVGNFLAFDPDYVTPATPDLMPHPSEYAGQASLLYEQQPDGSFLENTRARGLYFPDSKCMGLAVWDEDLDGDLDLFQGNDHQANFLFRNDGGHFTDVALEAGVAVNSHGQTTGSMHGAVGDVDGDGHLDLLVPDLRYGAMYRNLGNGTYEDITERSGIADFFNGKGQWTTAFLDFDLDGDLDIFAANGTAEELILQHPLLLENDGQGNFTSAGPGLCDYFSTKRSGRAAAILDYDNDGDPDILVSHLDLQATPSLLRNDRKHGNHWLGLQLEGANGPAQAIGARVEVHTPTGTKPFVNQFSTGYLVNHDPRILAGLGQENQVEFVDVVWADGTRERFTGMKTDRYHRLREGLGQKL